MVANFEKWVCVCYVWWTGTYEIVSRTSCIICNVIQGKGCGRDHRIGRMLESICKQYASHQSLDLHHLWYIDISHNRPLGMLGFYEHCKYHSHTKHSHTGMQRAAMQKRHTRHSSNCESRSICAGIVNKQTFLLKIKQASNAHTLPQ